CSYRGESATSWISGSERMCQVSSEFSSVPARSRRWRSNRSCSCRCWRCRGWCRGAVPRPAKRSRKDPAILVGAGDHLDRVQVRRGPKIDPVPLAELAQLLVGQDHGVLETGIDEVGLARACGGYAEGVRIQLAAGQRFGGTQDPRIARLLES